MSDRPLIDQLTESPEYEQRAEKFAQVINSRIETLFKGDVNAYAFNVTTNPIFATSEEKNPKGFAKHFKRAIGYFKNKGESESVYQNRVQVTLASYEEDRLKQALDFVKNTATKYQGTPDHDHPETWDENRRIIESWYIFK